MNANRPAARTAVAVENGAGVVGLIERAVLRHHRALVSFLRWKLGSDDDARDAEQDTWTRLLKYRNAGQAEVPRTLVMRIAASVVIDRQRYEGAHRAAAHVPLEGLEFEAGEAAPDRVASDRQDLAAVKQVILQLPPRCREIFVRSRIYGMSHAEIACELGISAKAVERHITRALHRLRREVGERDA